MHFFPKLKKIENLKKKRLVEIENLKIENWRQPRNWGVELTQTCEAGRERRRRESIRRRTMAGEMTGEMDTNGGVRGFFGEYELGKWAMVEGGDVERWLTLDWRVANWSQCNLGQNYERERKEGEEKEVNLIFFYNFFFSDFSPFFNSFFLITNSLFKLVRKFIIGMCGVSELFR